MEDIIILGCGPAAYMAAVYNHTANLRTLIVEEETADTFTFTSHDKVVGVMNVSSPQDLIGRMQKQADKFKIKRTSAQVQEISMCDGICVTTASGVFRSRCVIIEDRCIFERLFGENAEVKELEKKGVFVCGKITEVDTEAIILIGSGCLAAFKAKDFLD